MIYVAYWIKGESAPRGQELAVRPMPRKPIELRVILHDLAGINDIPHGLKADAMITILNIIDLGH